ncbi:MAG: hypothetical protein L6Q98_00680 [Anaerolineae bacterium]|nr:hypothetical protein [Anaerolineae bacterium]NUQ04273.1 hypothetical protein [Anaerolineae bacterium]
MKMLRYTWIGVCLVLFGVLSIGQVGAQEVPSFADDAAILIVDVFEAGVSAEPMPLTDPEVEGQDCAAYFDGMDGHIIDGTAGKAITSGLFALAHPHGTLVAMHVAGILTREYQGSVVDSAPIAQGAERWDTTAGGIWVVKVGTDRYSVNSIITGIDEAIQTLETDLGVTRIVVNMSFAVIPCGSLPERTVDDYLTDILSADADPGCQGGETAMDALTCRLDRADPYPNDLASLTTFFQTVRAEDPPAAVALSVLQLGALRPQFAAQLAEMTGSVETPITVTADPASQVILVASAGNDDSPGFAYYPAADPNVLAVSAYYGGSDCPIGSDEEVREELRSYLERLGIEAGRAESIANAEGFQPETNPGEVMDLGYSRIPPQDYYNNLAEDFDFSVLGCLFGTSFAAPRVSVRMAEYLLAGNAAACANAQGDTTNPPFATDALATPVWGDVPLWMDGRGSQELSDAKRDYCLNFPVN